MSTIDWYDRNASAFDERTRDIDVVPQMRPFLDLLPPGAEILDAGCGPGRDIQLMVRLGFPATGFDASRSMVDLARANTVQTIHHLAFHQLAFVNAFDGIWANASLLHVPTDEIDDAIRRLKRALRANGVLYVSVKAGDGVRTAEDGRVFNDYSEPSMRALFARHVALDLISIEHSAPGAQQVDRKPWLHALARKTSPPSV
ncbi:MAG: class I SAM-dependent methyltransferase [Anaerolineae bacterium]|nr:class I SAM-dependent methyltransferase [Phycisphaerae bacterium]